MMQAAQRPKELRIYLLRHAATLNSSNYRKIEGRSNFVELTDAGVREAEALGKRLLADRVAFDRIYSSPAVRAMATAEIVSGIIGYGGQILKLDGLQTLCQGDWEGKSRELVHTPEVKKSIMEDPLNFKAPNGESQLEVEARISGIVEGWKREVERMNKNLTIAAFGHGISFKCLIRNVMGSDPALTYNISLNTGSISELSYVVEGEYPGWHLLRLNDLAHVQRAAA